MKPKDVIIIGAGPAGLSAAYQLLEQGASVILFDKHIQVGKKACAGGFTKDAWQMGKMSLSEIPTHARAYVDLEVRSPIGSTLLSQSKPFVIIVDRIKWASERLDELRDLGCDIRLGERFVSFDQAQHKLVTCQGRYTFGKLIGADGAVSKVRRQLGLDSAVQGRCWQFVCPVDLYPNIAGLKSPVVWFEPKFFGCGYGWAFVSKDELRLGCGAPVETVSVKSLKNGFFDWLQTLGINLSKGKVQTGSIGCNFRGYRFGDVFLAGDAAGLASPITGEGIAQALCSGREVALEILNNDFRSTEISQLALRHRRTSSMLMSGRLGPGLYCLAPGLLRIPWLAKKTMSKYVL